MDHVAKPMSANEMVTKQLCFAVGFLDQMVCTAHRQFFTQGKLRVEDNYWDHCGMKSLSVWNFIDTTVQCFFLVFLQQFAGNFHIETGLKKQLLTIV